MRVAQGYGDYGRWPNVRERTEVGSDADVRRAIFNESVVSRDRGKLVSQRRVLGLPGTGLMGLNRNRSHGINRTLAPTAFRAEGFRQ